MKEEEKRNLIALIEAEMYQIRNRLNDMASDVEKRLDLLRYKLKEIKTTN